jgi:hypothetical protein
MPCTHARRFLGIRKCQASMRDVSQALENTRQALETFSTLFESTIQACVLLCNRSITFSCPCAVEPCAFVQSCSRAVVPSYSRSFVLSCSRAIVQSFLCTFVQSCHRVIVPFFFRSVAPSFNRTVVPSFFRSVVPSCPRTIVPSCSRQTSPLSGRISSSCKLERARSKLWMICFMVKT